MIAPCPRRCVSSRPEAQLSLVAHAQEDNYSSTLTVGATSTRPALFGFGKDGGFKFIPNGNLGTDADKTIPELKPIGTADDRVLTRLTNENGTLTFQIPEEATDMVSYPLDEAAFRARLILYINTTPFAMADASWHSFLDVFTWTNSGLTWTEGQTYSARITLDCIDDCPTEKTDAMPKAWLARFGRTVSGQVLDAVEKRLRVSRTARVTVSVTGKTIDLTAQPNLELEAENETYARLPELSDWLRQETQDGNRAGMQSRTMTLAELLIGSSFTVSGETNDGSSATVWGRMAQSSLSGSKAGLSLDGDVTTGLLGVDYAHGTWTSGAVLSHSSGGDAKTGFGADIGTGVTVAMPASGLTLSLEGRSLLIHEAENEIIDTSYQVSIGYDPVPPSKRGLSLSLHQSFGGSATGGKDALFSRKVMVGLAADGNDGGSLRLERKVGYGLLAFGFVDSRTERAYSLAWHLSRERHSTTTFQSSLEATRHKNGNDNGPEHDIGFRFTALWWALQRWRWSIALRDTMGGVRHDDGDTETRIGIDIPDRLAYASRKRGLASTCRCAPFWRTRHRSSAKAVSRLGVRAGLKGHRA